MSAFLLRMPAGIPGIVSRVNSAKIEQVQLNASLPFSAYGMFGKTVSGLFVPVASGDAATVVRGLLVRPYPGAASQQALGAATPPTSGIADRLLSGYMTVALAASQTAAKDGQVYVRITADARAVGSIEVGADAGECVAVVGAFFVGPADADNNVEIAYNV